VPFAPNISVLRIGRFLYFARIADASIKQNQASFAVSLLPLFVLLHFGHSLRKYPGFLQPKQVTVCRECWLFVRVSSVSESIFSFLLVAVEPFSCFFLRFIHSSNVYPKFLQYLQRGRDSCLRNDVVCFEALLFSSARASSTSLARSSNSENDVIFSRDISFRILYGNNL